MTAVISLAVVDDHPLFREGVIRSLTEMDGFSIVGEGSSKEDALRIAAEHRPDVLLLDISMPGGGLDAVSQIMHRLPDQKIVMLTVSEASDDVMAALKSGAKGYVLKGVGARTLADIIRSIATGDSYVAPTLSARLISESGSASEINPFNALTDREREVLELASAGLSNKHIGLKLDLHEKTIKHHMTQIFAKLAVSNRTEAAMAFRDELEKRRQ
ncbi:MULTISPECIES: response regulator transcription factor [unclassified Rhizobium]|jgi:two-component system nitrate/nitrite response regulator NarL|uniref:response regulator n=1 Tax=unclassified Rhizobium TaxID=2613769 RepID=UPI0006464AF6|nr:MULTISPECIES: response regulator transcription factor [unclassified Rhizobium]MBN8950496.1 response regulator transcription factor [Rhizobium tropici]OJY66058.1 MAG: DNA-binding response regulator [Rhizobium sp. 60-20]RKD69406.1 LuxR family two component transcriptional regulator [Rhizobium sp. WW_1]